MRLTKARVQKYRSIRDTGWFDVEQEKTILVGPNEAGKTVLLQALQQLNRPEDVSPFDVLPDYPRAEYNDVTTGNVDPSELTVVEGHFALDDDDKAALPEGYDDCTYVVGRRYDDSFWHRIENGPELKTYGEIKKELTRLAAHADPRVVAPPEGTPEQPKPSASLQEKVSAWPDSAIIEATRSTELRNWLEGVLPHVDEESPTQEKRYDQLMRAVEVAEQRVAALTTLESRLPAFVLFNNYFRVHPQIHLDHLASRIEGNMLDDDQYDYGNQCLLKLLGFTARELSNLGNAGEPDANDADAMKQYRDQLNKRKYQLNAASVRLTTEIRKIWQPDPKKAEADNLKIDVDGQYLKVVVADDLGVDIELDQRSEGFQWLVSFFVVFFAEAIDKHENAILLLDEPGLSLHGLKQREFRSTVSRLAEDNQTVFTTHSPFMVGPDELDLVRVVEMVGRETGTKVHTTVSASDSTALLPLQEALGYDLAQSLFTHRKNLVMEGLTDYWYVETVAQMLRDSGEANLDEKISLVPAGDAGKVVYYATILHAQKLKVAALLDSDSAGDQAAQQEHLVHTLGNKRILRTKDSYDGPVKRPEVEDMLRDTLVSVAADDLGWDVEKAASSRPEQPIADLFNTEIKDFSKYRLAKAFLRWARTHEAADLPDNERKQWCSLVEAIGVALK